jgi:hypothetical protein
MPVVALIPSVLILMLSPAATGLLLLSVRLGLVCRSVMFTASEKRLLHVPAT